MKQLISMISIAENRDCMAAMAEFPDKFFDLAIVDPPYGIGYDGAKKKHIKSRRKKGKIF
jgi:site-specific DNA-methyltransferase (adenine-specific)